MGEYGAGSISEIVFRELSICSIYGIVEID